MFHLRFGLSDHLKALLDFVFGSRRRVKKVRIFRAWFSQSSLVGHRGLNCAENSGFQNTCKTAQPGLTGNLSHLRVRSEGPSGIEYEAQPGIRRKTTKEEDGGGKRKTKGQRADLAKGVGS